MKGTELQIAIEYKNYFEALIDKALLASRDLTETKNINHLGGDIDEVTIKKINKLVRNDTIKKMIRKKIRSASYDETQLRELSFWRWVAYEGYNGYDPRIFPLKQELEMTRAYMRTGWPRSNFSDKSIIEIGCGPLGMIEYLPASFKVAFDPLNKEYSKLFSKVRSADIHYISSMEELQNVNDDCYDLGICYNVIDHTDDPENIFSLFFDLIKPQGKYIFQVNTVRNGYQRKTQHEAMHPSPFTCEKIMDWLRKKTRSLEYFLSDSPSADNEFYFFAYGVKS